MEHAATASLAALARWCPVAVEHRTAARGRLDPDASHHGGETEILQRPGRVFARAAAADVATRHQDGGAAGFRLVEFEVRLGLTVGVVTPVGEQVFAETRLRSGGEKTRRDDLVGVDVGRGHGDRA